MHAAMPFGQANMTASGALCRSGKQMCSRRLHLSSVALALPVVVAVLLANLGGRDRQEERFTGWRYVWCEHGWPMTFLERAPGPECVQREMQCRQPSRWRTWEGYRTISWPSLAADAAICILLVAVAVISLEVRRRRRRRLLQVSMFEILIATAVCAALAAYAAWLRNLERRTTQCLLTLGRTAEFEPLGPRWLCDLVDKERLIGFGWRKVLVDGSLRSRVYLGHPSSGRAASLESGKRGDEEFAALKYLHDHYSDQLTISVGSGVSDFALARLRSLTRLRRLQVQGIDRLLTFTESFPDLRSLTIGASAGGVESHRSARSLASIGRLSKLRSLAVFGDLATSGDLASLTALSNLETLSLEGTSRSPETGGGVAPRRLSPLAQLRKLKILRLKQVGEGDLAFLAPLTSLQCLQLSNNGTIRGRCFADIGGARNLHVLDLIGTTLDRAAFESIPPLRELVVLRIGRAKITEASLDHLNALTALTKISLGGTSIRTLAPIDLRCLANLRDVFVGSAAPDFDAASIARLEAIRPAIQVRYVRRSPEPPGASPSPSPWNPFNWFK